MGEQLVQGAQAELGHGASEKELDLAAGRNVRFTFVPHLVPVNQGICTTIFASLRDGASLEDVSAAYTAAYGDRPFVRLLGRNQSPDTKNISGTNFIDVGWAFDERARQPRGVHLNTADVALCRLILGVDRDRPRRGRG